ncbi:MAG TPA: hypothetical protein ENG48_03310 [Candidatus Atribacteria bacterium]|nr:hypothetical protein [Candidatus Atribacteria bacterium]
MPYRRPDGSYANPMDVGKVSFQTWLLPEEKHKVEAVIWHMFSDPSQKKRFLETIVHQEYLKILSQKGLTMEEFYQQYEEYLERNKRLKIQRAASRRKKKTFIKEMKEDE